MRHIKLDISLEEFKSRVPGFIPSFHRFERTKNVGENDLTGGTVVFDERVLKTVHEDANYGLFPSDVMWKDGTEYTYPKLRTIYTFFRKYYGMLRKPCCGNKRDYTNAVDMYENEGKNQPLTRSECEELDATAESYGADIYHGTCELYDDILDDMLRSCDIPDEYADAWGTDIIYHADVSYWVNWFKETESLMEEGNADCCRIEKYEKLGGHDMLDYLSSITVDGQMRHFTSLDKASIDVPLSLCQKIDAMGDFTPICEEYETGVNYSSSYDEYGTVIVYDGNTYIKKNGGGKGYKRNNNYKRDEWDPGQWEPYDDNGTPLFKSYAYKGMRIYVNPFEEYVVPDEYLLTPQNMSDEYELKTGRFFLIGGTPHETFNCDYVVYQSRTNSRLNGTYLKVSYDGTIPYVTINGKKRRATFEDGRYVFDFGYKKCSNLPKNIECEIIKDGEFVSMNGTLFKVDDDHVTVEKTEYALADAYSETDDYGIVMFVDGDAVEAVFSFDDGIGTQTWEPFDKMGIRILSGDTVDEHTSGYEADYEGGTLIVYKPYTVYNANITTGTCDSKLDHIKDAKLSYDDYGNELPGCYHAENGKSPVPKEGELLDIPYHVGNVSNCEYLGERTLIDRTIKDFNGDIITQIAFYCKDVDGNVVDGTVVKVNNSNYVDSSHKNNLPFIKECEDRRKAIVENNTENIIFDGKLYCDITYYLSNDLSVTHKQTQGETTDIGYYELVTNMNGSITYTDKFTLEKKEQVYGFAGGDDYKVYYYSMEPEQKKVVLDDFRGETVIIPQSNFTLDLNGSKKIYDKPIDWMLIWFEWVGTHDLDISVTTSKLPEGFDRGVGNNGVGYGRNRYDGKVYDKDKKTDYGWYPNPEGGKKPYNKQHPHIIWCYDNMGGDTTPAIEGIALSMDRYYNGFKPGETETGHTRSYEGMGGDEVELYINAHWFYEDGEGLPSTKLFNMTIETYNGGTIVYDEDKDSWVNIGGTAMETLKYENLYCEYNGREERGEWCDPENRVIKTFKYNRATQTLTVANEDTSFGDEIVIEHSTIKSPTFMEDAKFGMVLRQSVDGNIYVNRGVNQANDKHLRLMETRSVEAFEQYGNGFWNIIEP